MKRLKKGKAKKIGGSSATPERLSPEKYIRQKANSLLLKECRINKGWREMGLVSVCVAREHTGGSVTYAIYLIDLYCKGLKDTVFGFRESSFAYEDRMEAAGLTETISLKEAEEIIYNGLVYGDENGYSPHKEFEKTTRYLLSADIDERDDIWDADVPLGKDGYPCLVVWENQDASRDIAHLKKRLGEGNFDVLFLNKEGEQLDYWMGGSPDWEQKQKGTEELMNTFYERVEELYEHEMELDADGDLIRKISEKTIDAPEHIEPSAEENAAFDKIDAFIHRINNAEEEAEEEAKVIQEIEKAIEDGTANGFDYDYLAELYKNQDDYEKALALVTKAREMEPNDIRIWDSLLNILIKLDDVETMDKLFENVRFIEDLFEDYDVFDAMIFYMAIIRYHLFTENLKVATAYSKILHKYKDHFPESEFSPLEILDEMILFAKVGLLNEAGFEETLNNLLPKEEA